MGHIMPSDTTTKLESFRKSLYLLFSKRKDAIMNLLDALTTNGHQSKSVVQLSTSPFFERQYSSITDAIADGLPDADWGGIQKLKYDYSNLNEGDKPTRFIVDCTPNPRPHAKKLLDRHITHAPNPAPGNKPICVGHQYSMIVSSSNSLKEKDKKWVIPISSKMVPSQEKGNEFGMHQLNDCINDLNLSDKLNLNVADSLYGTNECRKISSKQKNLVHTFRLRNDRNVYLQVSEKDKSSGKGRKKEYGAKMKLNDLTTHPACKEEIQTTIVTRKQKTHTITIKC